MKYERARTEFGNAQEATLLGGDAREPARPQSLRSHGMSDRAGGVGFVILE